MLAIFIAQISDGHVDLADVLDLVAFVVAAVAVILEAASVTVSDRLRRALVPAAIALIALAFFVL